MGSGGVSEGGLTFKSASILLATSNLPDPIFQGWAKLSPTLRFLFREPFYLDIRDNMQKKKIVSLKID